MITITLTRKALAEAGACYRGLEVYDTIKALADDVRRSAGKTERRGLVVRWTRLHAIWLAVAYPSFAGWLVDVGLLPTAYLYGADLRGADLRGANLYGADLRGADLRGANLYGADLRGANLYGANLRAANLRGANLRAANLRAANLRAADLHGADLHGADLFGARVRRGDTAPEGWECVLQVGESDPSLRQRGT